AALAVLVRLAAERQPLVHADVLHTERACLLDEAHADVVREEVAAPAGAVLRISLPGADVPLFLQLVHGLGVAGLVRVDPAVDEKPVRAFQLLDNAPHRVGRLDGDGLSRSGGWDERQHHDVGVAVHEHVFDEHVGPFEFPLGVSTKCPCTSKMNSSRAGPVCTRASWRSSAASRGTSKKPPVLPAAAFAVLKASSVLAAPQAETRNLRFSRESSFEF